MKRFAETASWFSEDVSSSRTDLFGDSSEFSLFRRGFIGESWFSETVISHSDVSSSLENNFFLALCAAALALSLSLFLADFVFLTVGVNISVDLGVGFLPETPAGLLKVVEK